ncbi:MAG: amidohydrolase family protein [Pseudomonadota bacterium]
MLKIDFETHFIVKPSFDYLLNSKHVPNITPAADSGSYNVTFAPDVSLYHPKALLDNLFDIGAGRIAKMDAAKIQIQILSLTAPNSVDNFANEANTGTMLAKEANDELFAAIEKFPNRFKGFAALSPFNASEASKELERAVTKLGFVGWLTHSNFCQNDYLDDKKYWAILEAAESLNVPIYIHPTVPWMKPFSKYGFALGGSAMGFEFDTALCAMRMILAGVFDQFPKLKIILGHLGETLPFLMERLDHMYRTPIFEKYRPTLKQKPSDYLRENFYITTSGRFFTPTLKYVVEVMGADRVLFASDFPYESMEESVAFIQDSGLPRKTIDKIFHQNAIDLGFVQNVPELTGH